MEGWCTCMEWLFVLTYYYLSLVWSATMISFKHDSWFHNSTRGEAQVMSSFKFLLTI